MYAALSPSQSTDLGSEPQPQSLEAGVGVRVSCRWTMGVLTTEALSELKGRGLACLSATSVALVRSKSTEGY